MEQLIFWIIMMCAVITGNYTYAEISAMSSDNPIPDVERFIDWECGDERCWLNIDTGEEGP